MNSLEGYFYARVDDRRNGKFNTNLVPQMVSEDARVLDFLYTCLAEIVLPDRFAHVQQLHEAADAELDSAVEPETQWLQSGGTDGAALQAAKAHFAAMDRLLGQAILELDAVLGQ